MNWQSLKGLQKRFPNGVFRYGVSIAGVAIVLGATYGARIVFGQNQPVVNGILGLMLLVLILGAPWLGYGPGLVVNALLVFVAPRIVPSNTRTPRTIGREFLSFAILAIIGLIISRISQMVHRREAALVHTKEDLEAILRRRADEAVESAEAMRVALNSMREQARLLDLAHDGIFSMDSNGVILFWNRGAEHMYGWRREEAAGKVAQELLRTEFSVPRATIVEQVQAKGHWEGELTQVRKDGSRMHVASRWALRNDPDGQPAGFLEITTDITERHHIEEKLRHTQKLESLGVLAGGVAHDFNNLLTGILGNASLALSGISPHNPDRVLLEEVVKAAERASDLTRQLLAYAGKGRFVMRTVNLSDLVREISGLIQTSIPKYAQLRLQLTESLPGIDADPGQLQQIVMNLVINGAEAIDPEGGTVLVETGLQEVDEQYIATLATAGELLQPGNYVLLQVHDTGSGIPDETLRKIFDPFFTTKFAGRGLGLSAVLGIVRAHRGALKVYSEPGRGTTFKVLFPVSMHPVSARSAPMSGPLKGSGTVLVADDEEIVREAARHTLERYGYQTLSAEDGKAAVERYRSQMDAIALVLLDLTMPVMSGEEALRHMQSINPKVRVLLSSGYNEVEAVQRFAGKGLAGFIQKPYTAAALAEKVKEVLTQ